MATVRTSVEGRRGCGYRSPGGLYLVGGTEGAPCGKLPVPLHVCPTCGEGIKPSRGWTWVNGERLLDGAPCERPFWAPPCDGASCPLADAFLPMLEYCGLIWVGSRFYETPADFMVEARRVGVSRRIPAVPKGFEPGRTWVLLAHREAIPADHGEYCEGSMAHDITEHCPPECEAAGPGIFTAFRPEAVEYVIKGDEDEEELDRLEGRGLSLVKVERKGKTGGLFS